MEEKISSLRKTIEDYMVLMEIAEKRLLGYGQYCEGLDLDADKDIRIDYGYWCCGEYCTDCKYVPASWFFLPDDELRKEVRIAREREKALQEEAKERAEYERLKVKFE